MAGRGWSASNFTRSPRSAAASRWLTITAGAPSSAASRHTLASHRPEPPSMRTPRAAGPAAAEPGPDAAGEPRAGSPGPPRPAAHPPTSAESERTRPAPCDPWDWPGNPTRGGICERQESSDAPRPLKSPAATVTKRQNPAGRGGEDLGHVDLHPDAVRNPGWRNRCWSLRMDPVPRSAPAPAR